MLTTSVVNKLKKEVASGEPKRLSVKDREAVAPAIVKAINAVRTAKIVYTDIFESTFQIVAGYKYTMCLGGTIETKPIEFQVVAIVKPGDDPSKAITILSVEPANVNDEKSAPPSAPFKCARESDNGDDGAVQMMLEDEQPDMPDDEASGSGGANKVVGALTKVGGAIAKKMGGGQRFRGMMSLGGRAIPSDFDWRVESPKCKDQINAQYNQGQCGSCYAFSATGALADRMCIARAKHAGFNNAVNKYSQRDALSCGTRNEGNMCINTADYGPTLKYANNCDGGFANKVMEYAVDKGFVKESCDPYDASGDALKHFEGSSGGENIECQLHNTGDRKVDMARVYCSAADGGEYSYWPLTAGETRTMANNRANVCDCPKSRQKYLPAGTDMTKLDTDIAAAKKTYDALEKAFKLLDDEKNKQTTAKAEAQPKKGKTYDEIRRKQRAASDARSAAVDPFNAALAKRTAAYDARNEAHKGPWSEAGITAVKVKTPPTCIAKVKDPSLSVAEAKIGCKQSDALKATKTYQLSKKNDEWTTEYDLGETKEREDNFDSKNPKYKDTSLTDVGQVCRCPMNLRTWDPAKIKVVERGAGALNKMCKRGADAVKKFSVESCNTQTDKFRQPTTIADGTVTEIKRAIMEGGSVTASISACDDFMNLKTSTEIYKWDGKDEGKCGGHSLVLFGWGSNPSPHWLGRNSWGIWPRDGKTPGIFKIAMGSKDKVGIKVGIERKIEFATPILEATDTRSYKTNCPFVDQKSVAAMCIETVSDLAGKTCTYKNKCDYKVQMNTVSASMGRDMCGQKPKTFLLSAKGTATAKDQFDCCVTKATQV